MRCYAQYTLTRGINFWWALAVVAGICLYLVVRPRGNGAWGVFVFALALSAMAVPVIDPIGNVSVPAGKSLIIPVTATSPLICADSRSNCGIRSRPWPSISTCCPQ